MRISQEFVFKHHICNTHTHTHTHTHTYMHTDIHARVLTIFLCLHTNTHNNIYTYTHARTHTHTHTCTVSNPNFFQVILKHFTILKQFNSKTSNFKKIQTIHMHTNVHTCIHTYIHKNMPYLVLIYIYIYIYIYICTCHTWFWSICFLFSPILNLTSFSIKSMSFRTAVGLLFCSSSDTRPALEPLRS
jgi:hypothetical protein